MATTTTPKNCLSTLVSSLLPYIVTTAATMTILSKDAQATIRSKASEVLDRLQTECATGDVTNSWLHKGTTTMSSSADANFFHTCGFLHKPAFTTIDMCQSMQQEMLDLVDKQWTENDELHSFATNENVARGDYFLESADRVHFFAEPSALDEKGMLREQFKNHNKMRALNKVGHALHVLPAPSAFGTYTCSDRVLELVTELGWKDPVVPQSMYILKQAETGGVVHSHQDSTFLFTEPRQSCLGLWLALDDATLENGCLWIRPRSHCEGLRRQFVRNVEYFGTTAIAQRSNEPTTTGASTTTTTTKLCMNELLPNHRITWDGSLPDNGWEGMLEAGFIPIECKAGDLLAFCGEIDHLSLPNTSQLPRHTFQLHLVEGPSEGIVWSSLNWLQYPNGKPFVRLRDQQQS